MGGVPCTTTWQRPRGHWRRTCNWCGRWPYSTSRPPGSTPPTTRAVEIAALRIEPSGAFASHSRRVNPWRPIPAAATAVHGITDEDVAHEPSFRDIAPRLARLLDGCDLAGFNIGRLRHSPARGGVPQGRPCVLDGRSPRRRRAGHLSSLRAARPGCCSPLLHGVGDIEDAHSARGDLVSTLYVLRGQLDRYGDLPREVAALDRLAPRRRYLVWRDGAPLAGLRPAPRASARGGRARRSHILRLDASPRARSPRSSPMRSSGSVPRCLPADPAPDRHG